MSKKVITIISALALVILAGGFWYFNIKRDSEKIFNNKENYKNSRLNLEEKKEEANENELVWYEIRELGIKFKLDSKIKDELIYFYKGENDGYGTVLFSSKKLSEIPGCEVENGPLTAFSKIRGVPDDYPNSDYVIARSPKQFDGFFVLHDGPQAVCARHDYIEKWKRYFEQYPEFKDWSIKALNTIRKID